MKRLFLLGIIMSLVLVQVNPASAQIGTTYLRLQCSFQTYPGAAVNIDTVYPLHNCGSYFAVNCTTPALTLATLGNTTVLGFFKLKRVRTLIKLMQGAIYFVSNPTAPNLDVSAEDVYAKPAVPFRISGGSGIPGSSPAASQAWFNCSVTAGL